MQRAKFADRKKQTRTKILIGEAVERAGAIDLSADVIEAVLAHYVETAGEAGLRAYVAHRVGQTAGRGEGGSAAARRDDGDQVGANPSIVDRQ